MNTFINYYEILHVSQDAPVEIIRLAYKGLAQKYHPDRYQGNDANEKMQLINEALEVLTNENKRKDFDLKLNSFNQQKQKREIFKNIKKERSMKIFSSKRKIVENFQKMMIKIRKKPKILISILISIFQKGFIFLSHF
ncbi:J domain-containing protein [Acinetobacter baumannii]|uniref:J domain-containing protein n=1 Tax=Acinetobacter baumannii TaxID=470 RepID=UPI0024BC363A|nr:J domain-containing protein [Acinetobacter baumannii]WFT03352.1 J domain-containing protein [Acinetobacter baumannii]